MPSETMIPGDLPTSRAVGYFSYEASAVRSYSSCLSLEKVILASMKDRQAGLQ